MSSLYNLIVITEHDQLYYLVYEQAKVKENDIRPHLWSYRQRISLEHLGQTLQEKKLREKYPILHEFLQMVCFGVQCLISPTRIRNEHLYLYLYAAA